MQESLRLDDVALIGRTFREYSDIFALGHKDLSSGPVLDAAGGVSSFTAEASAMGYDVISTDKVYSLTAEELRQRCHRDLEEIASQLPGIAGQYNWEYYGDIEGLLEARRRAFDIFIKDYVSAGTERYVKAELPRLPFEDGRFSLVLVSHLLFLYESMLDYAFHRDTLLELLRVSSHEVRVFPMVNIGGGKSVFLDMLLDDKAFSMYKIHTRNVGFEFLKGANEMLVLRK